MIMEMPRLSAEPEKILAESSNFIRSASLTKNIQRELHC